MCWPGVGTFLIPLFMEAIIFSYRCCRGFTAPAFEVITDVDIILGDEISDEYRE
jgi:hypothetical protein